MNYKQIEQKAEEGKELLSKGIFPNELIENIKDKRVVKDLMDKIFYPKNGKKHHELSDVEKAERAKRLKVEIAFGRYLGGFRAIRFSFGSYVLIGILVLVLNSIYPFGNEPYGIATLIQSVVLFVFSIRFERLKKNAFLLIVLLSAIQLIELLVFQLPTPVFYGNTIDLSTRLGVFWQLLNAVSPFLYLGAKIGILLSIFISVKNIQHFLGIKKMHELNAENNLE